MPDAPSTLNALFTVPSLLSLQGASAARLLGPNVLAYLIGGGFKPFAKWVGFGIAIVLALLTAILASDPNWIKYIIALFNSFLIFASNWSK
ncbi:MAG TPA: hypothetical protein VFD70_05555 [Anaerolineae bacterium]|nr:hypothetical protein [Anaerolineae bacterium]